MSESRLTKYLASGKVQEDTNFVERGFEVQVEVDSLEFLYSFFDFIYPNFVI